MTLISGKVTGIQTRGAGIDNDRIVSVNVVQPLEHVLVQVSRGDAGNTTDSLIPDHCQIISEAMWLINAISELIRLCEC